MQKSPLFAFLRLQRAFIIYKIIKKPNDGAIRHTVFYSAAKRLTYAFALFNENGVPPCSARVFSSDFSLPIISSPIKFSVFFFIFHSLAVYFFICGAWSFYLQRANVCKNEASFSKSAKARNFYSKRSPSSENLKSKRISSAANSFFITELATATISSEFILAITAFCVSEGTW